MTAPEHSQPEPNWCESGASNSPPGNRSNLSVPTISLPPLKQVNIETQEITENHQQAGAGRRKVVQLTGAKLTRERKRTLQLMETLPKGITIGDRRDGRPKPYFVRYGTPRKVESFTTEIDRNDYAQKLADKKDEHGTSVLNFDPAEWREFQEWKANRGARMTIKDAVPKYMAMRLAEDLVEDSDHHTHVDLHLKRLVWAFGDRLGDTITSDELRAWFPSIQSPRLGGPIGKVAQRNHRKDVNFFFSRGVDEGWWLKNPCRMVKPPKVHDGEKVPLKPREIFDLLHHNRAEPVVGKIALELFGGLRASSAGRLVEADLNFAEHGVAMPGAGHKSTKRKFRQGHPDVLWAWLTHAPAAAWKLKPRTYTLHKSKAFTHARVKNPGNVLRDSFASYLLATLKDLGKVGYFMQHTHRSTTEVYEGIATEADARLVMAMTPEAVSGSWEQFMAMRTAKKLTT
jgi:site-specific recombinase XerD